MEKYTKQVLRFVGSILANFKKPRWWGSLLAALALTVLAVYRDETVKAGWEWLWPHIRTVLEAPLWQGGIFLIGLLALFLTVSWWDVRPRREKGVEGRTVAPLSDEERRLVQDVRMIWERYGAASVGYMLDTLGSIAAEKDGLYWIRLVDPKTKVLRESIASLNEALDDSRQCGIEEVRNRFNEMYQAYREATKWVAEIGGHEGHSQQTARRLEKWKGDADGGHFALANAVRNLLTDPRHRQSLTVGVAALDPFDHKHYVELVRAAERTPKPSALDSGEDLTPTAEEEDRGT